MLLRVLDAFRFYGFFTDHSLINLVDKYGRTPIFYSDDYYFTKFLIRNGANINHIDNFGRTLLFIDGLKMKS